MEFLRLRAVCPGQDLSRQGCSRRKTYHKSPGARATRSDGERYIAERSVELGLRNQPLSRCTRERSRMKWRKLRRKSSWQTFQFERSACVLTASAAGGA